MTRIAGLAVLALLALLALLPAEARNLDGTTIPDTLTIDGEKKPLVLNGAGYRKKFMIKVYIGALYATDPIPSAERVLDATTPRVMRLHFLRDVSAAKIADGWRDGIADNSDSFSMRGLAQRVTLFGTLMRDMKAGDVMRIDLLPRGTTRVSINDKPIGSVDGTDFQNALLKVWIGAKPADADMKAALLAAGQ
jgi:hypothetical protein